MRHLLRAKCDRVALRMRSRTSPSKEPRISAVDRQKRQVDVEASQFFGQARIGDAIAGMIDSERADLDDVESYDWKAERITLPEGRPGLICYFYDLSERSRLEILLRQSEQRYRNLFDSMMAGYCLVAMIYDAQGRAVVARRAVSTLAP